MKMFKAGNKSYQDKSMWNAKQKQSNRRYNYTIQKTCSACGELLKNPTHHICDTCAEFLSKKLYADL